MNLDTLVRIGQPPWQPTPAAEDVDVWDKYDYPACGTYRLGGGLVVFMVITMAGSRSLWAYVPVPPDARQAVTEARFNTEAEFDAFLRGCFTGREVIFAAAENFVITSKSDGILIPAASNALLAAATKWYIGRAAAALAELQARPAEASGAGTDPLLHTAQNALANLPA